MLHTLNLAPGITLRCAPERRFHNSTLSIQLVRPMCPEETSRNALLPEVLLRGCREYPDMRRITLRLDELYGSAMGALVRRVGDYQTTGLYADFLEDRFVPEESLFDAVVALLMALLLDPLTEADGFRADYVESEKGKLLDNIASRRDTKQLYAMDKLMEQLCGADSYGVPQLGKTAWVEQITPACLYGHYRRILRESRIEVFYVGSREPEAVANTLRPWFQGLQRAYVPLPPQSGLRQSPGSERRESLPASQSRLCMGYICPEQVPPGPVLQVLNVVLGGDQTGKLFCKLRQEQSLCYAVDTAMYGCKGILTVSAGISASVEKAARQAVEEQLEQCRQGLISEAELRSAHQALRATVLATLDSPVYMEHYFSVHALSGGSMDPETYIRELEAVTVAQLAEAARALRLHSVFFLKGVGECG